MRVWSQRLDQTCLFAELRLDSSNYQRLVLGFVAHLRITTLFCTLWSTVAACCPTMMTQHSPKLELHTVSVQYWVGADLLIWNSTQGCLKHWLVDPKLLHILICVQICCTVADQSHYSSVCIALLLLAVRHSVTDLLILLCWLATAAGC